MVSEGSLNHDTTAPEDGVVLAPPGGDVNQLQGMHVLPESGGSTVIDEAHLKVTGLRFVPSTHCTARCWPFGAVGVADKRDVVPR